MELNQVVCADSLDVLKSLPDNFADLILTDPPFGLGIDGQKESVCPNPKHNRKAYEFMGWDTGIPSPEYFEQMFRVSKNQIIWGGNYFTKHLPSSKGWLVWDKGQRDLTMSDCELAFSSYAQATRIFTFNRCELKTDEAEHPTQKPLKLMCKCLQYSKIGGGAIVLDPFGGSGTTAIAALESGLNYIIIEKEPKYIDIINRRIENWHRQTRLF